MGCQHLQHLYDRLFLSAHFSGVVTLDDITLTLSCFVWVVVYNGGQHCITCCSLLYIRMFSRSLMKILLCIYEVEKGMCVTCIYLLLGYLTPFSLPSGELARGV